jgi:hypothetical protein
MRSERRFFILCLAGLALVLGASPGGASGALQAEAPVAVSPGDATKTAVVESRCPTFSWGEVEGATSYELVAYRLGEDGEEAREVLRQSFPGSPRSRAGRPPWSSAWSGAVSTPGRFAPSGGRTRRSGRPRACSRWRRVRARWSSRLR